MVTAMGSKTVVVKLDASYVVYLSVNPWRSSSVVEQGTHKPLVASSILASATNP